MKEFVIRDRASMRSIMVLVWNLVVDLIEGGALVVTVARESKSRKMERKYHAMINDIAKSVLIFGKHYPADHWKALLVDQYEQELVAQGEQLSHPGQVISSMDGKRFITLRASTVKFRVSEGASFIEYLYAEGTNMGAVWSEPSLRIYEEYALKCAA